MLYVVNKPVGALNTAITEWLSGLGTGNAVLLGAVLGLMMAFDMGGPVNKSAYVFGTGLLANGVYEPMAAIMAAGMVPLLRSRLPLLYLRIDLLNRNRMQEKQTTLWDFRSLQKVQSHSQQQIHCVSSLPSWQDQPWQVPSQ